MGELGISSTMDLGILLRREVLPQMAVCWWDRVGCTISSGIIASSERSRDLFVDPNAEMDHWESFAEEEAEEKKRSRRTGKMKKVIKIDIVSDTVCPWCFIGKKYMEKAMDSVKDKYDFEVRWHPFQLNPKAPTEGVAKMVFYKKKFGDLRFAPIVERVKMVFADLGLKFTTGGKTGNSFDSHRLLHFAGLQGLELQNNLVEELFINYFTQEKYLGDKKVLIKAADKVGVKGAKEFLNDPKAGVEEVKEELNTYGRGVTGVPHFLIDGHYQLSGAQPPESFLDVFELAANHTDPDDEHLNLLHLQ